MLKFQIYSLNQIGNNNVLKFQSHHNCLAGICPLKTTCKVLAALPADNVIFVKLVKISSKDTPQAQQWLLKKV